MNRLLPYAFARSQSVLAVGERDGLLQLWVTERTPPAAIAALNAAFGRALQDPTVRARMMELGATPLGGTPEQMGTHVRAEAARWAEVVRKQGIRAE